MKPMEIETGRLYIKAIESVDLDDCCNTFMLDTVVQKYLCWTCSTKKEAKGFIDEWQLNYNSPDKVYWLWGIFLKETEKCIGIIDCIEGMLGYVLGRHYWNKGIMSEAAAAVLQCMFRHTTTREIIAEHNVENVYSGKVLQNIGMNYIKQIPGEDNTGKCLNNLYLMTIGRYEYQSRYNKLYKNILFRFCN